MSQINDIRKYLESHKRGITSLQAFQLFGVTRLSAVIYELKHRHGMNIVSESKMVKTRYGKPTYVSVYKLA